MSISAHDHEPSRCSLSSLVSLPPSATPRGAAQRSPRISSRRIEANRRNARKSTGPRTKAGKHRVSQNARKHSSCTLSPGQLVTLSSSTPHLCSNHAPLDTECSATFDTFLHELEQDLRPRTALHRILFIQIANLFWDLRRLPDTQKHLFSLIQHSSFSTQHSCQLLASHFSSSQSNPFTRLSRYERSQQSALLRLLAMYFKVQKKIPTTPYDDDEPPVPKEQDQSAWDPPASSSLDVRCSTLDVQCSSSSSSTSSNFKFGQSNLLHETPQEREARLTKECVHRAALKRERHLEQDRLEFEQEQAARRQSPINNHQVQIKPIQTQANPPAASETHFPTPQNRTPSQNKPIPSPDTIGPPGKAIPPDIR